MVYPTVESISSLASYAKNIHMFSDSYLEAANTSYRTYSVALTGQHGDAVQAFVDKLNTLQAQVFDQYPTALATYAQTVATYEEALTGHGFNERMWSDKSGSEKLKELYTGDQATEISDKVTEMNNLLKSAAEAAGVEAPDLSSIKTTATDGFKKAGNDRGDLASDIDSKWKTFTETLTNNAETIKAFQPAINNATYLSQLSLTDIANRITSGQLSAEHMYYLDGVQNDHDIKVVKLLLSEADYAKDEFFDKLGSIEYADKLSDGGSDVVFSRVYEEMNYLDDKGHSDGLGYFFQSMTVNLTQEQASAYSKKLSESATRFATTLKAQALGVHPEFGTTAEEHENYLIQLGKNKPLYRSIEAELKKAALLSDVLEYIYANELGYSYKLKDVNMDPRHVGEDQIIKFGASVINGKSLSFNIDQETAEFEVREGRILELPFSAVYYYEPWKEKSKAIDHIKKIVVKEYETSNEAGSQEASNRINELRKAKEEANRDFLGNLAVSSTGQIPIVGPIVKKAKQAIYDDKPGEELLGLMDDIPVLGTVKGVFENVVNHSKKLSSIESEISKEQSKYFSELFDASNVSITTEEDGKRDKTMLFFNRAFDLESTLMQYDLQENGLNSYIYRYERTKGEPQDGVPTAVPMTSEEATKAVNEFQSKYKNDSDAAKLLKGNSQMVVGDYSTPGKVVSAEDVSEEMENYFRSNPFDKYSFDSYTSWRNTNDDYFADLVGSK